ncbi:MAG TPA: hypothetical protein VMN81_04215 [Vicinamibacterales bacterium]|nr:hypothetical protein [Vicinamibacterales bacterium]
MLEQLLTHRGHIRRLIIADAHAGGWEITEELDSRLLSRSRYRDWHRVEQAVRLKVSRLEQDGWSVEPST